MSTLHPAPAPTASIPSLFSLAGQTAIVTGGAAGIGLAVAEAFAEAGANVAIWYNTNPAADSRAAELSARFNVTVKAYKVQVTDREAVQAATDRCVEELGGRLDVFVANAGIAWTKGGILDAADHDHYRDVMATDLDSVYNSAFAAGCHFRRQRSGVFIATASISGHIVNLPQFQATYNAAKAGVIHFCKSLAVEWAAFGARVNTVSPGYVVTDISKFASEEMRREWIRRIPMGREALPVEMKGAYLFLASPAGSYTTGADIVVDGGYCAP